MTGWLSPNIFRQPVFGGITTESTRFQPVEMSKSTLQPVITVKQQEAGCHLNLYGHEVEILGGCRVVYRPDNPKWGAKVWIETLHDVKVIS
jgi:hypothetical protein